MTGSGWMDNKFKHLHTEQCSLIFQHSSYLSLSLVSLLLQAAAYCLRQNTDELGHCCWELRLGLSVCRKQETETC